MEYFIRQLSNKKWQIAKFDSTKEPTDIYFVEKVLKNEYYSCSCMGFRRNQTQDHKHIGMVMYLEQHEYNHFTEEGIGSKV